MARPIETTPVLTGRDARTLLEQSRLDRPVSPERVRWLDDLAEKSKSAEQSF